MPNTQRFSKNFYARLKKIRNMLGMGGVSRKETKRVRRIGSYFEWLMLLIIIWLPFLYYFDSKHLVATAILDISNWIIWGSFLFEAVVLLYFTEKKLYYFATNWINFLIIVVGFPLLWTHYPLFASIRALRIILALSIIIPWVPLAIDFLSKNHLGATLIVSIIVTILGGIGITFVDAGFKDPTQGIWWAWETVTSVGYGDIVPTTLAGKIIAVVIMLLGTCLFSLLTANFSAYLIGKRKTFEKEISEEKSILLELKQSIDKITTQIESIEEKISGSNSHY